jgi:GT2 family glycosyltransferase
MILITVCIPVYNEGDFIDRLLSSLVNAPPAEKEIYLIDGGSKDDTLERIKVWKQNYPQIKLVNNDLKYVSHGFNIAYRASQSTYITLMGAHAEYPPDYFMSGISLLEKEDADAVGGPLNQTGRTEKGKVIAACMSSQFGVGDSEFRTTKTRAYVQTVAMAIYKRSVFEKIGLLDEDLIRDQDDEFHYRMNANGLKILMDPSMEATYYVRDDFSSLWSQYFNYGLYKPLVFKKVRSQLRLRHLVPPGFVIYLMILPLLLFFSLIILMPLFLYVVLALFFSLKITRKPRGVFYAMISYSILHLSYGAGFCWGIFKL